MGAVSPPGYGFLQLKINIINNVRMEGQRVQYRSKRIISILFLFFGIFLFRFVLTSQFYRDLENTFQSIMYNDKDDMPFYGNNRKGSFRLYGIFVIPYSCSVKTMSLNDYVE